jgi:chromosome segregation ATPase
MTTPQPADTTPAAPEAEDAEQADQFDPERAAAKIKKANQEAASLRARLKELEPLARKAQELEEAGRSELEKAQKAANEATARLAEYEKTTIRQRVALTKGVPADLVDRLRGDTEDEIAADADALLALVSAPKSPRPDPSQGPRTTASGTTADQFAAALGGIL